MKKVLILAVALLFGASTISAQTPEEKAASAKRITTLKAEVPSMCDISQIDLLVVKCEAVAKGTVAIDAVTSTITGEITPAVVKKLESLAKEIEMAGKNLGEAAGLLSDATLALKQLKNPLRIRPATKCLSYAKNVITAATAELPYQGKIIAAMVKK